MLRELCCNRGLSGDGLLGCGGSGGCGSGVMMLVVVVVMGGYDLRGGRRGRRAHGQELTVSAPGCGCSGCGSSTSGKSGGKHDLLRLGLLALNLH